MAFAQRNNLLLIEDDSNDVLLIQRAFERTRFNVPMSVVSDGDSAVGYLQGIEEYSDRLQHPLPSLILLDLKLPRRSGLEVLKWLRAQPHLCRIPVIALTASREEADVDKAYEAGINSYVVKPSTFDGLFEMAKSIERYWIRLNLYPSIPIVDRLDAQ